MQKPCKERANPQLYHIALAFELPIQGLRHCGAETVHPYYVSLYFKMIFKNMNYLTIKRKRKESLSFKSQALLSYIQQLCFTTSLQNHATLSKPTEKQLSIVFHWIFMSELSTNSYHLYFSQNVNSNMLALLQSIRTFIVNYFIV